MKTRIVTIVLAIIVMGGAITVAFYAYDFTQEDPRFCNSCHIMEEAFIAWQQSIHNGINCHVCHKATIADMNRLLFATLLGNKQKISERHGKTIVPSKRCLECHLAEDESITIARSYGHARHVFMERLECTQCHGITLHKFLPEERFCVKCHMEKRIHARGMEEMPCLGCHNYGAGAPDLLPTPDKCLFCHAQAITGKEGDQKPSLPPGTPMAFSCIECHRPHTKARPTSVDCLRCHSVSEIGKHGLHLSATEGQCMVCHQPHRWRVSEVGAREICAACHEYRPLEAFFSK